MKQYEAVIQVMRNHGGYATLGFLYQKVPLVSGVTWKTKTPFASIRRIVQTRNEFFKIKPGLWALEEFKDQLPKEIFSEEGSQKSLKTEHGNHTFYQGLLVQIGNLRRLNTYIPRQDKNRLYLGEQRLGHMATLDEMLNFSYSHIVDRARTIDVVWFNERNIPDAVFEVEHSTDMQNSLVKFVELQDFNIHFYIVSDHMRKKLFEKRITYSAFQPVRNRVKFLSYDYVADWHAKTNAWRIIEDNRI